MIFSWYRQKVDEFGLLPASRALCRVAWNRAYVKTVNALLSQRIECPCCGWRGRRLFDYVEIGYTAKNIACPRCDSHARHRTLFLWLRDRYQVEQKKGRALMFAPERALAPLWRTASELSIIRIDLEPSRGVHVIGNIMKLPLATGFARIVWCHHVLDLVPDDREALKELTRVLDPEQGELIVSVSEGPEPATTEFGFANAVMSGIRRSYGADFIERLAGAGLTATRVDTGLTPADRLRYGLVDEPFYLCRKKES